MGRPRENGSIGERNRGDEGREGAGHVKISGDAEDCLCCKTFTRNFLSNFQMAQYCLLHTPGQSTKNRGCLHLITAALQTEKKRMERASKSMAERTIDAQRASATIPRYDADANAALWILVCGD